MNKLVEIEKLELESLAYVKKLARTKCPAAIETLVELMENSEDERIRVACANSILDRGLGKPAAQEADDDDGDNRAPLRLVINNK